MSEAFQLFLLDTIDKRMLLLHRNLQGIQTISECLPSLGEVSTVFWESLETFLAS